VSLRLRLQVLALGKPTVLVMSNGGALAIDTLVAPAAAIVEAFNPAQQAAALAALLFGHSNRWGKLP
jgi:beta-glucosidase